jgi:hypothetical protein
MYLLIQYFEFVKDYLLILVIIYFIINHSYYSKHLSVIILGEMMNSFFLFSFPSIQAIDYLKLQVLNQTKNYYTWQTYTSWLKYPNLYFSCPGLLCYSSRVIVSISVTYQADCSAARC